MLALALSAMFSQIENVIAASSAEQGANNSMGPNPMFMPSKGQRVKNKLHRKWYK